MSKQGEHHIGKQNIHRTTTGEILSAYVLRSQALADGALRELDVCFARSTSFIPAAEPVMQDDYLEALSSKFPMLDSSELKICALLRTYYSPIEIAVLVSISVSQVEAHCERIAQKLGVQQAERLDDVLRRL